MFQKRGHRKEGMIFVKSLYNNNDTRIAKISKKNMYKNNFSTTKITTNTKK